jgi:plastocyanin
MRLPPLATLLLCLSTGCTVGEITDDPGGDGSGGGGGDGSGGGGGGGAGSPDAEPLIQRYTLTSSPTDHSIKLAASAEFDLLLESENFAGPVTIELTGLPASWTATFTPSATVELPENGDAVLTVQIAVPSDGEATTATLGFTATGALGPVESTVGMAVANELVIPIGAVGSGNHGFQSSTTRAGALVRFVNGDTIGHRIHASGAIAHQPSTMGPGQSYDVVVDAGTARYYCHDHGEGTGAAILTITP